jgi:hypothetical protein
MKGTPAHTAATRIERRVIHTSGGYYGAGVVSDVSGQPAEPNGWATSTEIAAGGSAIQTRFLLLDSAHS